MRAPLEERLSTLPDGWTRWRLAELPGVQGLGYGITRPGPHTEDGVGMIRAADIQDGHLRPSQPRRISRGVHQAGSRSRLRTGDLVVVLVGRVGEAAAVTEEYHDWNASRTVAVVRMADPGQSPWLRLWLGSSYARDWCESRATGTTLQRTLSLAALRDLPVPLPPAGQQPDVIRAMRTIEAKSAVNTRIGQCAMALADARFAVETLDHAAWPERPFGELARLHSGTTVRPHPSAEPSTHRTTAFAAPADILQADLPYLPPTDARLIPPEDDFICPPYSLLVVAREAEVRAVVNEMPVLPGRGVLTLRPESTADRYWLLHELRSRSAELTSTAQGAGGRELSRRAFAATGVRWPPQEVRARFAHFAERLHLRAQTAYAENRTLDGLRDGLLDALLDGDPLPPVNRTESIDRLID